MKWLVDIVDNREYHMLRWQLKFLKLLWEVVLDEKPEVAQTEDGIYGAGSRFRVYYYVTDEQGRRVSPEGFVSLDLQALENEL